MASIVFQLHVLFEAFDVLSSDVIFSCFKFRKLTIWGILYLHSTSSAGGKWLGDVTHPQLGQLGLTL